MEQILNTNKVLLLDGGLSNELNKRVSYNVHKEKLWTAKALYGSPTAVIGSHYAYLKAGADIIKTASYQATLEGFKKYMNLGPVGARNCIQDSVALAKVAVNNWEVSKGIDNNRSRPVIAGSLGPYGVLLCDGSEYSGSYMTTISKSEIAEMHLPRILALVEGGAELLAVETMPSLEEVRVILDLIKEHAPQVKVWVSFSIREGRPTHTAFGDGMEDAYQTLASYPQVWAWGINCCVPKDVGTFLKNVKSYNVARPFKIIVYPNSGQDWLPGQGWLNNTVPSLDMYVNAWLKDGVNIIGGCCQVGAEEITKLRRLVDNFNAEHKLYEE